MNAEKFVKELSAIAPSREDLVKYDLPEDYINEVIQGYQCKRKLKRDAEIHANDTILNLINEHDCSGIQIGLVNFSERFIETPDYYQIGHVELDILSINKITLQVEVRDHDSPGHVIWLCATHSDSFLNALLVCADLFAARIKDSSLDDNENYVLSRVHECTEKAGGEEYMDFYKMLLS
jgi:hypothetical protein